MPHKGMGFILQVGPNPTPPLEQESSAVHPRKTVKHFRQFCG